MARGEPTRPEPASETPKEVGVLAVLDTLEDGFSLLLGEAPVLDSRVDPRLHVPATDIPRHVVEGARLGGRLQSLGLLLGDTASCNHLVEVIEDLRWLPWS